MKLDAVQEKGEYTTILTEYTKALQDRANSDMLEVLSNMRKMPLQALEDAGIFYINSDTEMLLPRFINKVRELGVISNTNGRPIFHNRYVIPIKDVDGRVLNLVGYSKEANERYVYGTSAYYRRKDTLYGLENLELAYDMGYAIVTEGITDTIRMRSLGYKNTFARCGTQESFVMDTQLNRCRYGVIHISDRDVPGQRAEKRWKNFRQVHLKVFNSYKDVDEMCSKSDYNKSVIKEHVDFAINWLKEQEHKGKEFTSAKMVVLDANEQ